jgi:phosphoribosylaminoimidazole (AIR) synthetase
LNLVDSFPQDIKDSLKVDDKTACEQWNRGIGFLTVVSNEEEAQKLIDIAEGKGCEAKIAGEITDESEVNFRGHTWPVKKEG